MRCLQVPMTLLIGAYVTVSDQDASQNNAPRHGRSPNRLTRLATAFSCLKFVRTLSRVASSWVFSKLFARGFMLPDLAWCCGCCLVLGAVATLVWSKSFPGPPKKMHKLS